jgi:hypothetical protein
VQAVREEGRSEELVERKEKGILGKQGTTQRLE